MMPKRNTRHSRLKNTRKIATIVSFLIILFIILSYTVGTAFAWYVDSATDLDIEGETGQVKTNLDFKIKDTIYGIPGATQGVSEINQISLGDKTEGFIFKIDYIAKDSALKNLENLGLSKDIISTLGLIEKHPIDTATNITRTYYGRLTDPSVSLGELYVKFKEVSELNINDGLDITVELNVIQIDKEAFADAFNISDTEMYIFNSLFI